MTPGVEKLLQHVDQSRRVLFYPPLKRLNPFDVKSWTPDLPPARGGDARSVHAVGFGHLGLTVSATRTVVLVVWA